MRISFNDRLERDSKLKPYSSTGILEADIIFLLLCNLENWALMWCTGPCWSFIEFDTIQFLIGCPCYTDAMFINNLLMTPFECLPCHRESFEDKVFESIALE